MHRAYLQKPKSSLYTSKNRVKNIKIRNKTAWKCKMTFTYTGAWVSTPTVKCDGVGGKQEFPANICTVDSQVYRQHFHSRQPYFHTPLFKKGYSSFQKNLWIHGLQTDKSSKLGKAPEPKVNLAPSTGKWQKYDIKISRCLIPWWAMTEVTLTLCGFCNHQLPKQSSRRWQGGAVEDWHSCSVQVDEFHPWRTQPSCFNFKSIWVSDRLPCHTILPDSKRVRLAGCGQPQVHPAPWKPSQQD